MAPVSCVGEVDAVMDALLSNRKLSAATHHIMAYRITRPDGIVSALSHVVHHLRIEDGSEISLLSFLPSFLMFFRYCTTITTMGRVLLAGGYNICCRQSMLGMW